MAGKKQRLDVLLVERGLAPDLAMAGALIGAGKIQVAGQRADKAGVSYVVGSEITIKASQPFVSRAGEKLAAGLVTFGIDPAGWICADIGASTGGFTDCLLQNGAARVYCVDVGHGLLAWKLRRDARVVLLERTNARHLSREQIAEPLDLAVLDASFISLGLLLPPLLPLFREQIRILALIKPQFELERNQVDKGGVVTNPALHIEAINLVRGFGRQHGLKDCGVTPSPVKGAKGNQEFIIYFQGISPAGTEDPSGVMQG